MLKYTPTWRWIPVSRQMDANCAECAFMALRTTISAVRAHLRENPDHHVTLVSTMVTVMDRGPVSKQDDAVSGEDGAGWLTLRTR